MLKAGFTSKFQGDGCPVLTTIRFVYQAKDGESDPVSTRKPEQQGMKWRMIWGSG
jgi:hypothetical protein